MSDADPFLSSSDFAEKLLSYVPFGLAVYRLDDDDDPRSLRLLYANETASRIGGLDYENELGLTFRERFASLAGPDAPPHLVEAMRRLARVALSGEPADLGDIEYRGDHLRHGVYRIRAFPLADRIVAIASEEISEQLAMQHRLQQQEDEYRALAGATFEGIALAHGDRTLLVNDALAAMLGRSVDDLMGQPPVEILGFSCSVEDIEEEQVVETRLPGSDGSEIPVEIRTRAIRFQGQKVCAFVVRDVSERVRAMAVLERQAIRYRAIFDATFQFIGLLRPDGTLLEANRTALEFGGLEAEDVIGKLLWEVYWWSHSEAVQAQVREAITRAAGGEFVRFAVQVQGEGGRLADIDFSLKPVFDRGEVVLLIPEGRDITDEVRAQQSLRRLQRRTAHTLNAAGEGIVSVDRDGIVIFVNQAAASLLGRPASELLGRPHAEVLQHVDAEGQDPGELPVDRVLQGDATRQAQSAQFARPSGERFPVEYVVTPVEADEQGGAVVVFRDVTERVDAERALRESEARHRTLVESLHEGVILQDPEGNILTSNPAARRILALSEDELHARSSLDGQWWAVDSSGTPLSGEEHPAMVALRTGQSVEGFVQGIRTPHGEVRWILVNSSPIPGDDGDPARVVSTFTDITEERRAQQALRSSVTRQRTILSTLEEGVLLLAPTGKVLAANPAVSRLLGVEVRVGENFFEMEREVIREDGTLYAPEELPERAVLQTGQSRRHAMKGVRHPDGSVRWLSVNAEPVPGRRGDSPRGLVVSFDDITEQVEAERALKEREAQLRAAQQIAHVGDWRWEVASGEVHWSAEMYRIFGHEPDGISIGIGQFLEYIHPDDRERLESTLRQAREDTRPYVHVYRIVRPNGEVRYIQSRAQPVRDAEGTLVAFQGTAQDITEQEQARIALRRYARELEERNEELEQFAYVASHDLQEPLRMVSSFLQLLQRRYGGELDAAADEYIAYAVDGAKRMQALIRDLLAYSRVGTRGKPFQRVDLGRVAEEVLVDLGPAVSESGGRVEVGALPEVEADPTQMRQLVQNLVGNALKFSGEAPPVVTVGAERSAIGQGPETKALVDPDEAELTKESSGYKSQAYWRVWVRDEGIGIAPEHRERIFQIFQRLHTREEYDGTGIGLAICRKIVERHGGQIWVEAGPEGRGTVFSFTLPVKRPPSQVLQRP